MNYQMFAESDANKTTLRFMPGIGPLLDVVMGDLLARVNGPGTSLAHVVDARAHNEQVTTVVVTRNSRNVTPEAVANRAKRTIEALGHTVTPAP